MSHKHHTKVQGTTYKDPKEPHPATPKQGTLPFGGITYTYKEISKTDKVTQFALYDGNTEICKFLVEGNATIEEAIKHHITALREESQSEEESPAPMPPSDFFKPRPKGLREVKVEYHDVFRFGEVTTEILSKYESLINDEGRLLQHIHYLETQKAYHGALEAPVSLEMQLSEYKQKLDILRKEIVNLEYQLENERREFDERDKQNMPDYERKMRRTRISHLESEIEHKKKLANIYVSNIQMIEEHMALNSGNLSLKTNNLYTLTRLELEQVQKELEQVQIQIKEIERKFRFI